MRAEMLDELRHQARRRRTELRHRTKTLADGCVAAGGRASQQTYATHVWEVRPTDGRGKPARYLAGDTEGSCDVAADCFGMANFIKIFLMLETFFENCVHTKSYC